jgi:predicted transglutaminase-like cysteine proteinase
MALGIFKQLTLMISFAGIATAASAAEASMMTGARTSQPIGHYEFCQTAPDECRATGARPAPLVLTSISWGALNRVNAQVNRTYRAMTDMDMWGKEEVWLRATS